MSGNKQEYMIVKVPEEFRAWLWSERRRRDRSITWIVCKALEQYQARIEKGKTSKDADNDD